MWPKHYRRITITEYWTRNIDALPKIDTDSFSCQLTNHFIRSIYYYKVLADLKIMLLLYTNQYWVLKTPVWLFNNYHEIKDEMKEEILTWWRQGQLQRQRQKQKINLHSHNSSFLFKCQLLASKPAPTFLETIIRTYIKSILIARLNAKCVFAVALFRLLISHLRKPTWPEQAVPNEVAD